MNTSSFYRYLVGGLACLAALLCFTSVYAATENKLSEPEEREALKSTLTICCSHGREIYRVCSTGEPFAY
jgi:hypothetical protein